MPATHLEILVEEPSMEAFLRALMPRLLPPGRTFRIHPSQGKRDLLSTLGPRLAGYARWLPPDWRIVVIVDRDRDSCHRLKAELEAVAKKAGLRSKTRAQQSNWQLANRIAIEELEAWYFGDWEAVQGAYPRVPKDLPARQGFRDSDAIPGGTWETFERILKRSGYFKGGLPKTEVARTVGARIDPNRCHSASFNALRKAIAEAFE